MNQGKLRSPENDRLFDAILALRDREECYRFFEDICTVRELSAIAQRLQVVKLLDEGLTYIDIAQRTGASTATISRVNRCLVYGAGGYRAMLDRLPKED